MKTRAEIIANLPERVMTTEDKQIEIAGISEALSRIFKLEQELADANRRYRELLKAYQVAVEKDS